MNLADTGLRLQPFRIQGKPLVTVSYAAQKNALHFLNQILADKHGLGLFHGPPLSGKTTIIQQFASSLPRDHAIAVVDGAQTDSASLLKEVLKQYGYAQGLNTASERFNMIRVLAMQQAAVGQAPLLFVENVHAMSPGMLELLCELAEMSVEGNSALRIVLVSDRPMLPLVAAPAMRSIENRLTGKFLLKPLTRTETAAYAHSKLKSGGCNNPKSVMPPLVCDRLHTASGGWPGVIDRLAIMALAKAQHLPLQVDLFPKKPPQKPKPPNVIDPTPQMILTCKGNTLKRVNLDKSRLLIGRNELCDIHIVHEWISRQHAIIVRNGKSTVIVDLNSRNGIFVNGKRVKSHVLINSDIVSLGDHRLKFVDPSATERTSLRGAGWDDTTLAESIKDFRRQLLRQINGVS